MYSTCYGLSLTTLSLPQGEAIELRLVYVLAAVATVLLANRFILPNTAKEEFLKSVNALLDIDEDVYKRQNVWLQKNWTGEGTWISLKNKGQICWF